MHAKYHNQYYWENLIRARKLEETFNSARITEQSVFFHGILYNSYGRRKLLEDVIHFAEQDALTGYLYYVFFPTAFLSFTNEEKGITVPLGISLPELIGYVSSNDFVRYHNYLRPMYQLLELSIEALQSDGAQREETLRHMESIFNYSFQQDRDAYGMMHIYRSPRELGEYFASLYQIDGEKQLGAELFYHKTGLRKHEWESIYTQAASNIFTGRKFMNCISNLLHEM